MSTKGDTCKWCGSLPTITIDSTKEYPVVIQCPNEMCPARPGSVGKELGETLARWRNPMIGCRDYPTMDTKEVGR